MDFEFTREQNEFRQEVEDWVRSELPDDWDERTVYWPGGYGTIPFFEKEFVEFSEQFNRKLGEKGWLGLCWPEEYGGRNSNMLQAIVGNVLSYYRAPSGGVATTISAPTIMMVGSEEMKRKWLPKITSGEETFWLGYSEPNAGSDLVAIKTSAVLDGDEFVINGQKIWSSGAHVTGNSWLIAKTDPDAPKHKGASLIIVPNESPGVTIRPIINICGIHSFNEVYFDDVRVPRENLVGELNRGFYNVMLALQFERLIVASGLFQRTLEDLIQYAKDSGLNKNPDIRRKLADLAIEVDVFFGFFWRCVWMMDNGQVPELEASGMKLFFTELGQTMAEVGMDMIGLYGNLDRGDELAPFGSRIALGYLDSVSGPIGAGTSEIQRSIIAQRGLGLPRK